MSKNPLRKSACTLALLLFCLAFGAGNVAAQSTTQGAIGGTVKDPQGAVVDVVDAADDRHPLARGGGIHAVLEDLVGRRVDVDAGDHD